MYLVLSLSTAVTAKGFGGSRGTKISSSIFLVSSHYTTLTVQENKTEWNAAALRTAGNIRLKIKESPIGPRMLLQQVPASPPCCFSELKGPWGGGVTFPCLLLQVQIVSQVEQHKESHTTPSLPSHAASGPGNHRREEEAPFPPPPPPVAF